MSTVIQAESVIHSFGPRRAIDEMSFEVHRGEVFAFLGPNGAGKTTTVRLLNGLYAPKAGRIRVLGMDPSRQGQAVRSRSGVLTETPALYERLSARQNLEFFGNLAGMPSAALKRRITELFEFFDLSERADDRAGKYSKGMKQRLALARAILAHPEVVFLDEPTSGLDPESALQVRDLIQTMRREDGQTVFLCTHHLAEAERLCDRVAILNHGRVLACGSLAELNRQYNPGLWVEIGLFGPAGGSVAAADLPGALALEAQDNLVRVKVADQAAVPGVVSALVGAGAQILRVQPHIASLEDIYFKLQNLAEEKNDEH
jgi:ABC-2 type transport system ATP-binding protein